MMTRSKKKKHILRVQNCPDIAIFNCIFDRNLDLGLGLALGHSKAKSLTHKTIIKRVVGQLNTDDKASRLQGGMMAILVSKLTGCSDF